MMEAYVFYSHYEYSDIWPLMFGQSNKFLQDKKKYLITNSVGDKETGDWNIILYEDTDKYQMRVYKSLQQIKEEIIIFHHEDMFLIDYPKQNVMEKMINKVRAGTIDLIKVGKASYTGQKDRQLEENLFINPSNLSFAIQPTVIKKEALINIYKATKGDSIWSFENNSNNYVNFINYTSCYYYEGTENKRGLFHWDSNLYPYMATAVVKGKWDYECYPNELEALLKEYKIDPNIRGKNA